MTNSFGRGEDSRWNSHSQGEIFRITNAAQKWRLQFDMTERKSDWLSNWLKSPTEILAHCNWFLLFVLFLTAMRGQLKRSYKYHEFISKSGIFPIYDDIIWSHDRHFQLVSVFCSTMDRTSPIRFSSAPRRAKEDRNIQSPNHPGNIWSALELFADFFVRSPLFEREGTRGLDRLAIWLQVNNSRRKCTDRTPTKNTFGVSSQLSPPHGAPETVFQQQTELTDGNTHSSLSWIKGMLLLLFLLNQNRRRRRR